MQLINFGRHKRGLLPETASSFTQRKEPFCVWTSVRPSGGPSRSQTVFVFSLFTHISVYYKLNESTEKHTWAEPFESNTTNLTMEKAEKNQINKTAFWEESSLNEEQVCWLVPEPGEQREEETETTNQVYKAWKPRLIQMT